jgi:hypothetical protein
MRIELKKQIHSVTNDIGYWVEIDGEMDASTYTGDIIRANNYYNKAVELAEAGLIHTITLKRKEI